MVKKRKKKYRKQRQHTRRFKSGRSTLVNKGVQYKQFRTKGHLSQTKREVFQNLSKKPFETGGYMDFGKRGLERFTGNFGFRTSTEFEDDPDFEVTYHTHPEFGNKFVDYLNHFPSKGDLVDFRESDDQAMNIVHRGAFTTITRTKKFSKMNKQLVSKKVNELENKLNKDVRKYHGKMPIKKYMKLAKKHYAKLGLNILFIPKDKKGSVVLPVRVVERAKRSRRVSANLPNLFSGPVSADDLTPEQIQLIKTGSAVERTRTIPRGGASISRRQAIQDTLDTFQTELDNLAAKNDTEGMNLVQTQLQEYKASVGLE